MLETVVTINTYISKVAKQLVGPITPLISITGENVDINTSQNECMIKVGMTWHAILIIIIYEMIILAIIIFSYEIV